jgi:hypothetical protein
MGDLNARASVISVNACEVCDTAEAVWHASWGPRDYENVHVCGRDAIKLFRARTPICLTRLGIRIPERLLAELPHYAKAA